MLKYIVRIEWKAREEERRAGPSGPEDAFGGKIIVERNMMDNTRSGSEVALIREPSSTTAVNLGVKSEI